MSSKVHVRLTRRPASQQSQSRWDSWIAKPSTTCARRLNSRVLAGHILWERTKAISKSKVKTANTNLNRVRCTDGTPPPFLATLWDLQMFPTKIAKKKFYLGRAVSTLNSSHGEQETLRGVALTRRLVSRFPGFVNFVFPVVRLSHSRRLPSYSGETFPYFGNPSHVNMTTSPP